MCGVGFGAARERQRLLRRLTPISQRQLTDSVTVGALIRLACRGNLKIATRVPYTMSG
jgi:hypothetical protein